MAMVEKYISVRKAIGKHFLSEKDCVYVVFLLTIVLKKMQYYSNGGGHFNVNPDMVLIHKKDGEDVKIKLLGDDTPHEACNGKPDFDTESINPCFCAPESFLGRFSSSSDVYSLGMLLAYMLQRTYPYDINEKMAKTDILRVVKENQPKLEVSAALQTIICKSISKKVGDRYRNAEEMGIALMDYLGMEKPKTFRCFSDNDKKRMSEVTNNAHETEYRQETLLSSKEPSLDVDLSVRTGEGFKAVAGMDEIKKKLRRDFVEIVSHRELAKEFGIMPSNMLFYGAPGTGKTFISERLAEECGMDVCSVKPSDLGSIWLHGSQGLIKELFHKAEEKAKKNKKGCILLIDEFDAMCGARDAMGNEHQADEVAEWLTQLNDCVEKNVYVIGTTNCLEKIDKAVIRHGRIDQVIYVGLPDMECRKQLFTLELNKRPHDADINIDELAQMTEGYTSSDISYMVKETARNAFEASIKANESKVVKISETMLREVVTQTRPSVSHDELRKYERTRNDYINRDNKERPRIGFFTQK